jgi:hypothetical protein
VTLSYVWRRDDVAQAHIQYDGGTSTGPEHLQCSVDPQPASRVVRLVAGVGAAYGQTLRQSSNLIAWPVTWYLRITLENSAAPVGYPKVVHEATGAFRCSAMQVIPTPIPTVSSLPDMHTAWSSDPILVDTRRSDFARGSDPEGSPSYALNFYVGGIPTVGDTAAVEKTYASYRAFMKICCEVGTPG